MSVTYQNPIIRGMHPDPSIVRVNDTYYLVNSTFEYYPGITVMSSNDLLNWKMLNGVATTPEQADLRTAKSNEGIFAANIQYHDGYFYVITTNFAEFKTFIIKGKLNESKDNIVWEDSRIEVDVPGIDPDIYFENGHTYVQFTGYVDDNGTKAIRQVEINETTGEIVKQPQILTYGTGGRDVEGPHIFKKDGWYYLLTAEGGTGQGHMITIFRSKDLWGPYEAEEGINPIFTNRDRASEPLQNIGHGDLFMDTNNNWWLVCLGTRPADIGFKQITNLGRETLLYPVVWENGWPRINNGVPTMDINMSNFANHARVLKNKQSFDEFVDDFSKKSLRPEWLTLRDNLGDHLQIKNNKLMITGDDKTLNDLATPAFIGLRQTEHNEELIVNVDVKNSQLNTGEYGIAAVIDADNYVSLMVKENNGKYEVYREQRIFDIFIDEKIGELTSSPVKFRIINTVKSKQLLVTNAEGQEVTFTTDSIHLSNEAIAALNTGDIEGIYVKGDAIVGVDRVVRKALK